MQDFIVFYNETHTIDIFINVFIVCFAIQIWTLIGFIILSLIDNYETMDSNLLTCFFWFVIVMYCINIKLFGDPNDNEKG